jgi:CspA family cold shock protein
MASDEMRPKGPVSTFESGPDPFGDLVNETGAAVIEVTGVIKWFDVSKGYGFIVPDNGMADVLLHVTVLRRDGFQTAYEGARVVCEARSIRRSCRRRAPTFRWRRPAGSSGPL